MKVLVTTATFGYPAYDHEWVKQQGEFQVDFRRYIDGNFPKRQNALHPRLKGKIPKMMSWTIDPGYDYYIWLDSRFGIPIEDSITWMINECGDKEICLFPHSSRSSIAQELQFMESLMSEGNGYLLGRYEGEDMKGQVDMYLSDPKFEDNKLYECGAFIYKPSCSELMKDWFLHNCLYSVQDQLSLPYLLSSYNKEVNTFKTNIYNCEFFKYN